MKRLRLRAQRFWMVFGPIALLAVVAIAWTWRTVPVPIFYALEAIVVGVAAAVAFFVPVMVVRLVAPFVDIR